MEADPVRYPDLEPGHLSRENGLGTQGQYPRGCYSLALEGEGGIKENGVCTSLWVEREREMKT